MLYSSVTTFIEQHNLIPQKANVIVGLSGGPDSVFLLHYLAAHRSYFDITLIAAHLDHGWRAESAQDVKFCQELCSHLNIQLVSTTLTELAPQFKFNGSQEDVGRKARRHFFAKVKNEYGATHIALAHHADDQQETFFIRLLRGASLTGLTGIKPVHGPYIRPLLTTYKDDILAWLAHNNHAYLIDPTNTSDNYLRNRIRNHVLPALKTSDPRFEKTFARTIKQLSAAEDYIAQQAQTTLSTISTYDAQHQRTIINREQFLKTHVVIQQRILLDILCTLKIPHTPTQRFWHEIVRFIGQPGNAQHAIHAQWVVVRNKNSFYITPKDL